MTIGVYIGVYNSRRPFIIGAMFVALAILSASAEPSTSVHGWFIHSAFDATCERTSAKQTTAKSSSECEAAAAKANHSVFSWNEHSHHCFTVDCRQFSGDQNDHVVSGCMHDVPGCVPPPPPPPPGPMTFVPMPSGEFTMGRACPNCGERRMDDPAMKLEPGFLSYDEQPPHKAVIAAQLVMKQTLSEADFAKSGLPGTPADVSHETAVAFARWYTAQQDDGATYRLPTEAEWEYLANGGSAASGVTMIGREHCYDWHGVYSDPPSAANLAGPSTGILKAVRDGSSPAHTTRFSTPPDATNALHGYPATSFRLMKVAAAEAAPKLGPPPLPQVGILSNGLAQVDGGGTVDVSRLGPPKATPHFRVQAALPIPPDSELGGTATLTGLDPATMWHSHSPGLEVLPNGDVLAVWFTSSVGPTGGEPGTEYAINSRMVQSRLRHGSDRWDMPGLFYDTKYTNDQSALLWTEGGKTFFWGGGGNNDRAPFKVAVSEDSGGSWKMHMPNITNKVLPTALASQPITTAFRDDDGRLYMGVDSEKASSGLWRSGDNGASWEDTHGRTVGRHTTFFTVPGNGSKRRIMAFGGKNSEIDGFMPFTYSDTDGSSFAAGAKLPFPALGSNQRPCVHRLLSGNVVFVADFQLKGSGLQPSGFSPKVGESSGVYAALSKDDGKTWKIKALPVALPHETDLRNFGTLGYSTVRQGPNGVIHILSTMTHPCLHYEINEAWLESDESAHTTLARTQSQLDMRLVRARAQAKHAVASTKAHATTASGGTATWGFIDDPSIGGYALHGAFITTFPNSSVVEYNATYSHGVRLTESMATSSHLLWRWTHGVPAPSASTTAESRSVFERYDGAGNVAVRSHWLNRPLPRDGHLIKSNPADWRFNSLVADGDSCMYGGNDTAAATHFVDGKVDPAAKVLCKRKA